MNNPRSHASAWSPADANSRARLISSSRSAGSEILAARLSVLFLGGTDRRPSTTDPLLRRVGILERDLVVAFPAERLVAGRLEVAREADQQVALRWILDPSRQVERVVWR